MKITDIDRDEALILVQMADAYLRSVEGSASHCAEAER